MKFTRLLTGVAALTVVAGLAACSDTPAAQSDVVVLKVAAHAPPMTDVVTAAAESIEDGYRIELVEVADYVQPNVMLNAGEIDANFVQHEPFMEEFNAKNNGSLVKVQPVYMTVIAFYSRTLDSLDDLPEGGHVVIPQDPSNAARGLQLLADTGVITLDPSAERFTATIDDIAENPKNIRITQVDLLQLNTAYDEADAVLNLPAFARQIGLNPAEHGIAVEQDPRFAVSLVARADNAESPEIAALAKAFTSNAVRRVVEESNNPAAF